MKKILFILIIITCLVGCIQITVKVPDSSKTVTADNKSVEASVEPLQPATSAPATNSGNVPVATDAMETALKSTVLIFSTNQLLGDQARGNFWDEISQYQNSVAGRHFGNIPDINKHYWTQGAGVIIDKNGYILTNRNNLECEVPCDIVGVEGQSPQVIYVFTFEQGRVSLSPSRAYIATVIGKLPHDDLAIIKITPTNGDLPCVPLGDSAALKIGQKVTIIDYSADALTTDPNNISPITAEGTISSMEQADTYPINYYVGDHYTANVIQMSAPVDRRSKGAPVINKAGELVGLIISRLIYQDNLGFAIAINEAKDLIRTTCPPPSATPPATTSAPPSASAAPPTIVANPASWGESITYTNNTYGVSFMYPKTWVKLDASGDLICSVAVSNAVGADNAMLAVVAKTDDIAKWVKEQYDIALSPVGVKCDIVSARDVTLADGKTPATEVVVGAKIYDTVDLFGYTLVVSQGSKLLSISGTTFADSEHQALVKEIASTLAIGTDSSMSTAIKSPDTSQSTASTIASTANSQAREALPSLTISDVKYDIEPNGYPAPVYDVTVTWTTSVPSTSEVSYIRSDEGFSHSQYTLLGEKFGYGCPEVNSDSHFIASTLGDIRFRIQCINKITYVKSDTKLVVDHSVILHDLFKDTEQSETGINTTHQNFYLKVKSTSENNQTVESPIFSFKVE